MPTIDELREAMDAARKGKPIPAELSNSTFPQPPANLTPVQAPLVAASGSPRERVAAAGSAPTAAQEQPLPADPRRQAEQEEAELLAFERRLAQLGRQP